MYTFGYINEATLAHLDIDEAEAKDMDLEKRYYIFANEAMQTICANKPKLDYLEYEGVSEFAPVINAGTEGFRLATEEEINWETLGLDAPIFADSIDSKKWFNDQNIYLLNDPVGMPEDFIAFADKQAYILKEIADFDPELFVTGQIPEAATHAKGKATNDDFEYTGRNTVTLYNVGKFFIPYKGVWFRFTSGMDRETVIDMPIDIFLTIPIYVAAVCLEKNHEQKAGIKRAQFERALANCTATDFLALKAIV